MQLSGADKYVEICHNLQQSPLHQLEDILKGDIKKIDVSNIYLPRKHFSCLLRLIEERPDVEELVLDGTSLVTDDVQALKECLLCSCVSRLSLRGIKVDAAGANALRQLCTRNPGIVEMNLDGTCIPSAKIDEIQLIVNLNRLNAESLHSSSVVVVKNESSHVDRWQLCRETCKCGRVSQLLSKPHSARSIIDDFVLSREIEFSDQYFTVQNFNHPVQNIETIRWSSYCELADLQKEADNSKDLGFADSAFYNNACFCAALNALRSYVELTKSLLLRRFPQVGLYVFRLFIDGAITEVVVDDILPVALSGNTYVLTGLNSCCDPFYAALLEKAVAKAIGGFRHLEKLTFCDCIELLTGGTTFQIDLRARSFNSTVAFDLLRSLSERGQRLVACLIPRSQREAQACENDGIYCGLPYTILKAGVCRKNGAHYAYLLQIATPFPDRPVKSAFEYESFKSIVVNDRLVVWMTLEDFAVVFGQVYLIMWSFEDAASEHKTTKEFPAVSVVSTNSTLFANNSAFYIENEGNGASGVMVTLSSTGAVEAASKTKCLFYKYVDLGRGVQTRRYDVCDKNSLFKSDDFNSGEGSIFFNLLPRERLQMSIASEHKAALIARFSTVENVKVAALPETMTTSRLIAEWNTTVNGRRVSEQIICFRNKDRECNSQCVVALAQYASQGPPFPIGFFGWIGESSDVVSLSAPQFSTAPERRFVSVHSIFLSVQPGECLFILPYCCGSKCADRFELTTYSASAMSRTIFDTAAFL